MGRLRKCLIGLVALALLVVTILTRGSLGSAITGFCLIAMVSFLLLQKFLINRDSDDFQTEV